MMRGCGVNSLKPTAVATIPQEGGIGRRSIGDCARRASHRMWRVNVSEPWSDKGAFAERVSANMVCARRSGRKPPEKWHFTCFFLVGWGGLELIGRAYEALAQGIESRIRKQVGGK